jgi:putative flippase GtrA
MNRACSLKQWLKENPKGKLLWQFIKFGLVGLTNTAIAYAIYSVILLLGGHYLVGSIVSFVVSVAWSFLLNNRFVFRKQNGETRVWWKTLLKTYLSYGLTGLLLANGLLYVWVDLLKISPYLAFFLNLMITIPTNFLLNKLWAFRKETAAEPPVESAEASDHVQSLTEGRQREIWSRRRS